MMKPFAQILRTARQARDMTQEQLAEQLYVTRQAVSSWEKGRTQPDLDMLRKICQVLNLSPEELMLGKPKIEDGNTALIRAAAFCFWAMTGLCLAQGILAVLLRAPTPGFYAGLLFLCQVSVYPILSYMLRHRDYSLLAGYDAQAAYDFTELRHMVALLHAALAATGLLASILGIFLFFTPSGVVWLILVYVADLCGAFLVIEAKYSEQVYLPDSRDRILARMTKWSTPLGVLMLLAGTLWSVALCAFVNPETLAIGPFLCSLFGQLICGGAVLFNQNRAARRAVDNGQESCPLTRISRVSLLVFVLFFLWMTWTLL